MSGYMQNNNIRLDRHLSNIVINYKPKGLIGDRIFPTVNVRDRTGIIPTFNQADLFRVEESLRSPGTEAHKLDFGVSSLYYNCLNYANKADVTMEDRADADGFAIRTLEEGRVMRVQTNLMMGMDLRIASQVTSSTNVGTASNVASAWTDYTNSDPITDIETKMNQVEDSTGFRPNRMEIDGTSWRHMRRNESVINKTQSTALSGAGKNASLESVRELLGLDEINIGYAYYNTADEGQDMELTRIWGENVLVYYAPDRPSVEEPSFGYNLNWVAPGLPGRMQVQRLPFDQKIGAEEVQMMYWQDELITAQPLGALIMNTTSSQ